MTTPGRPLVSFDPKLHEYRVGGRRVPSVHEILEKTRYLDRQYYTPESEERGSWVHHQTARLDAGEITLAALQGHPWFGWIEAYARFVMETDFRPVPGGIEWRMVHSSLRWAGTMDRVGTIGGVTPGTRVLLLLDLKTGAFAPWHVLQLEAYRLLALEAPELGGELPAIRGVYLRDNGAYSQRMFPSSFSGRWLTAVNRFYDEQA